MNKEQTKSAREVMQAFEDGKPIEARVAANVMTWEYGGEVWSRADDPCWNWARYEYRVKPEPREFWIHFDPRGMTSGACAYICPQHHIPDGQIEIHVSEVIE